MPKEGLSIREQRFVEIAHFYPTIWEGGVEAGFSESYAKDRLPALIKPGGKSSKVVLIEALEAKKAEKQAENVANRQQRQQFWTRVMSGKVSIPCNMGDRLRASELLGKSEADFTDKYQDTGLEQRQRQLTEAEQAEAKRIAQIRLRQG